MSREEDPATFVDLATHRELGRRLHNYTWTFIRKDERTSEEDGEMVNAAHASLWHWSRPGVGEPVNAAQGEWQVSRVYAVLGRAGEALDHAGRCLAICEASNIGDFDIVFAHEALARAHAVAGDAGLRDFHVQRATALAELVEDPEDRAIVLADIASVPAAG